MRRTLPLLAACLSLAACGAEDPVPERRRIPLDLTAVHAVQIAGTHAELVVQAGWPAELHVWTGGHAGSLVAVRQTDDALLLEEVCEDCAQLYELVVPPETEVRIKGHHGPLSAFDLDGPLALSASGDVTLTGLAGPVDATVSGGDLVATGMWSAQFAARVDGRFDGTWTRPPSAMDVQAHGDLRAVLATFFYATDLSAGGAVQLNDFVPDPDSTHHVYLQTDGDLWLDFGPAQGAAPPRR